MCVKNIRNELEECFVQRNDREVSKCPAKRASGEPRPVDAAKHDSLRSAALILEPRPQ